MNKIIYLISASFCFSLSMVGGPARANFFMINDSNEQIQIRRATERSKPTPWMTIAPHSKADFGWAYAVNAQDVKRSGVADILFAPGKSVLSIGEESFYIYIGEKPAFRPEEDDTPENYESRVAKHEFHYYIAVGFNVVGLATEIVQKINGQPFTGTIRFGNFELSPQHPGYGYSHFNKDAIIHITNASK